MTIPGRLPVHVAVDLAVLTVREDLLQVLAIERGAEPYSGWVALPGGFLRADEDLRQTAERELSEETGLDGAALHLEQFGVYSCPDRDPRGRVISVAFLAVAPDLPVPSAGTDARSARWEPADVARDKLAFDHAVILDDAVERARARLEFTTLATAFCAPAFTIGDLRRVYEVVWGVPLDPRNFSRKVASTQGFVEATGAKRVPDVGRPAALYRRGPALTLNPPLLRGPAAAAR